MLAIKRTHLAAFMAVLALSACSSDDDSSVEVSSDLSAFEGYCTGTLLKDQTLMTPMGPGGWQGNGSMVAPSGSKILVEASFDKWFGYVMLVGGGAAQVDEDFSAGLVLGTDFSSECATDPNAVESDFVLLESATFFASQELSGEPCTLPAGASFQGHSYSLQNGNIGKLTSSELEGACGFSTGYSNDIVFGDLVAL